MPSPAHRSHLDNFPDLLESPFAAILFLNIATWGAYFGRYVSFLGSLAAPHAGRVCFYCKIDTWTRRISIADLVTEDIFPLNVRIADACEKYSPSVDWAIGTKSHSSIFLRWMLPDQKFKSSIIQKSLSFVCLLAPLVPYAQRVMCIMGQATLSEWLSVVGNAVVPLNESLVDGTTPTSIPVILSSVISPLEIYIYK